MQQSAAGGGLQPLVIMTAIPFGLTGAIWGHVLLGMDFTFLSMFGIVALTGVLLPPRMVSEAYRSQLCSDLAILGTVPASGLSSDCDEQRQPKEVSHAAHPADRKLARRPRLRRSC